LASVSLRTLGTPPSARPPNLALWS
jgi:hypothetical protein